MPPYQDTKNFLINRRKTIIGLGSFGLLCGAGLYASHRIPFSINAEPTPQFIKIAWPRSEEDSVLTIAKEKGFFERYGINVTIIPDIRNSAQALDCLKQNQCDGAVLSALDWLPQLLDGLQSKLLIGINSGNFRLLVSRKQKIERLADVSGVKIARHRHSDKEKLFFSILLRRKGLDPDKNIQWVEMETEELLPALLSNQVQGIIGHDPLMWQILNSTKKQVFELAGSQSGSWSTRANHMLGLNTSFLNQFPTILRPLTLSISEASRWQTRHLKETSFLLADQWRKMNATEILNMLQNENQSIAPMNNNLWEQVAQYIDDLKLLNKVSNSLKTSRTARQFCIEVTT